MKFLLSLMVAAVVMGPGVAGAEQSMPISIKDIITLCQLEDVDAETCAVVTAQQEFRDALSIYE